MEDACRALAAAGINPSVVKYSLAAKCVDAANVVATTLLVGRNRIVPEFTFMDPRGAGLWDGRPIAATEAALWALDVDQAGNEGASLPRVAGTKSPQRTSSTVVFPPLPSPRRPRETALVNRARRRAAVPVAPTVAALFRSDCISPGRPPAAERRRHRERDARRPGHPAAAAHVR